MPGKRKKDSLDSNLPAEFFVASQLLRLGHVVTVTFGHTKEVDLLVRTRKGRPITIDVKGLKNRTDWPVRVKLQRPDHYFVLVDYNNRIGDLAYLPETFVVPSNEIRRYLGRWAGGKPGQTAVACRTMKESRFKDAWALLDTPST